MTVGNSHFNAKNTVQVLEDTKTEQNRTGQKKQVIVLHTHSPGRKAEQLHTNSSFQNTTAEESGTQGNFWYITVREILL